MINISVLILGHLSATVSFLGTEERSFNDDDGDGDQNENCMEIETFWSALGKAFGYTPLKRRQTLF